MKRFVCVFLIALLLIPPMAVSAEPAPALLITGGKGRVGQTVEVAVSAANLPACASFELLLQYDTKVLKPTEHVQGDVSGLYIGNLNYTIIESDGIGKVGEAGIKIVGATSSTTTPLLTGDPIIVTLTFEIIGAPESSDGALVNMLSYSLSKMDEGLTKIYGIPLPSAYVGVEAISASLVAPPAKTTYVEGQALDLTGGQIELQYAEEITVTRALSAATITGFDPDVLGAQTVTATIDGHSVTFPVYVIAKTVERISIQTAPAKTEYVQEQDALDLTGGKIIVAYNNGKTEERPMTAADVSVTGFDNRTVGAQTLTVCYAGKTATFTVTILEKISFTDIPANEWYYKNGSIQYVYNKGLMTGMTATSFAPDGVTTRAQLVTILYRLEGEPAVSGDDGFTDVSTGDWFYDQVRWAVQSGMVQGMGDGTFAPDDPITRGQMATILFRYAKKKGFDSGARDRLNGFADADAVPSWYKEGVQWAVAEGIISGTYDYVTDQTLLDIDGTAIRAQIATVLMRYVEKFKV